MSRRRAASITGADVMVPLCISVQAMIGAAVIEAASFKVDPGVTAGARH